MRLIQIPCDVIGEVQTGILKDVYGSASVRFSKTVPVIPKHREWPQMAYRNLGCSTSKTKAKIKM